jgi:hypothetical protein
MFRLAKTEHEALMSQFATSRLGAAGIASYLGRLLNAIQVANVLNSDRSTRGDRGDAGRHPSFAARTRTQAPWHRLYR